MGLSPGAVLGTRGMLAGVVPESHRAQASCKDASLSSGKRSNVACRTFNSAAVNDETAPFRPSSFASLAANDDTDHTQRFWAVR